ncbi:MAG TPA: TlpA disulfide reductase family protein [Candidatus Limnocylindria bacterium]|jgi:cytochrome c biogenesis protein CcmG/thiol:disulfide interchange protein DsbE|nr:TlpA disulfide reductase family protein [Candidatus Limnocylindria bacterium]
MPRWLRYSIVLGIATLVVVLMLSFRRDPHDIRTGTVNKPAAAFTAEKLDGTGTLSLSDYTGKVVVLNFFASWCPPCKEENPGLVRVWERYRSSDVVFIGVVYNDATDKARAYVSANGVTWPTVRDDDGSIAFAYGVFGPPETYFIGPDGIIAGRRIGAISEATLVNGIDSLRPRATR